MTCELDLEAVLEREVGLPVDVRVVEQAPASFRYAVTRGEELFVRDREALSAASAASPRRTATPRWTSI